MIEDSDFFNANLALAKSCRALSKHINEAIIKQILYPWLDDLP